MASAAFCALLIAHISETDGKPASATRKNAEAAFADADADAGRRGSPTPASATWNNVPAGDPRRLDTQTITVTGGSFGSPYYTFDGGGPPVLEVGTTYEFETSGVNSYHPFAILADGNVVSN